MHPQLSTRSEGARAHNDPATAAGARRAAASMLAATAFVLLALASAATAQPVEPAVILIGDTVGNVGDTVEVPLRLSSGNVAPETLIIFLEYNPNLLTPVLNHYPGPSAFRPSQALTSRGILVDAEFGTPGVVGIAIFGLARVAIPDGALLTFALRIEQAAAAVQQLEVRGDASRSSAAASDNGSAINIPVQYQGGQISLGCVPPPAPAGVTATQGQATVVISWSPINVPGAEYRVFRSRQALPATAEPLGTGWQTATTFTDATAALPPPRSIFGCPLPPAQPIRYHYWVRARRPDGCVSAFSAPAIGSRGAAKAVTDAPLIPQAFPATPGPDAASLAAPGDALALRLAAPEPLHPERLWADVESQAPYAPLYAVEAGDGNDLWIIFEPQHAWLEGDRIVLRAGGLLADGAAVEAVGAFAIAAPEAIAAAAAPVPPLHGGLGTPLVLDPGGVYPEPRQFSVRVPADADPAALRLYYLDPAPGGSWHAAEAVAGWLASAPKIETIGNRMHLTFTVRHGGIVQLATPPSDALNVAPASPEPGLLVLAAALFLTLSFTNRRQKKSR